MRWKLRKVMGKTILEYLSMSLAFIPKSLSGGAWSGTGAGGWGPPPPGAHPPPATQRSVVGQAGGLRKAVGVEWGQWVRCPTTAAAEKPRDNGRGIDQTRQRQLSKSWRCCQFYVGNSNSQGFVWILIFTPLVSLKKLQIGRKIK